MHEEEFLRHNWNADPCSIQLHYAVARSWKFDEIILLWVGADK